MSRRDFNKAKQYTKTEVDAVKADMTTAKYRAVAGRCGCYFTKLLDGTASGDTSHLIHKISEDTWDTKMIFGNSYNEISTAPIGDMPNGNNIKVGASIEYLGVLYPVTFKGQNIITIEPGCIIESDPLNIEFAEGSTIFSRTYVTTGAGVLTDDDGVHAAIALTASTQNIAADITNPVVPRPITVKGNAAGIIGNTVITGTDKLGNSQTETITLNGTTAVAGVKLFKTVTNIALPIQTHIGTDTVIIGWIGEKWPVGFVTSPSKGEGVASGNLTESGTITNSSSYAYHPMAIIGKTKGEKPAMLLVGNSILTGIGSTTGNISFADIALDGYGTIKISKPGEMGYMFNTLLGHRYRMYFAKYCDIAICEYGINDAGVGQTPAQMKATMIAIWTLLKNRGLKVYQTTLTPRTSSTDLWATVENQTPFTYEANRAATNAWLRDFDNWDADTKALVNGIFDIASAVESVTNPGRWNVGMVFITDNTGTHSSNTGHIAEATKIDTTKLIF